MITKYKMKPAKKGKILRSPQIMYAPNLNTILMVENTLQNMPNSTFKISEVKRALPTKVNHYTLKNILEYLDESNKIYVGLKGIVWIHNDNPKLREAIRKGREI